MRLLLALPICRHVRVQQYKPAAEVCTADAAKAESLSDAPDCKPDIELSRASMHECLSIGRRLHPNGIASAARRLPS